MCTYVLSVFVDSKVRSEQSATKSICVTQEDMCTYVLSVFVDNKIRSEQRVTESKNVTEAKLCHARGHVHIRTVSVR